MTLSTDGNFGIGTTAPVGILDVRQDNAANVYILDKNAGGTSSTDANINFGRQSGSYVIYGSVGINSGGWLDLNQQASVGGIRMFVNSSEKLRLDQDGNVGIGTTTPSYPLVVEKNVSGISIYSQGNISASGYITRTDVYNKSKEGNALDKIKDSPEYYNNDGSINHNAFEYSKVSYDRQVIDKIYNETYEEEECKEVVIKEATEEKEAETKKECKSVEKTREVTTYKTINEEGVLLDKEVALLKQSIFDLKTMFSDLEKENLELTNRLEDLENIIYNTKGTQIITEPQKEIKSWWEFFKIW
jgi:hypothetical protein